MHKCVCVPTPFKLILASMYLVESVVFFFVFNFSAHVLATAVLINLTSHTCSALVSLFASGVTRMCLPKLLLAFLTRPQVVDTSSSRQNPAVRYRPKFGRLHLAPGSPPWWVRVDSVPSFPKFSPAEDLPLPAHQVCSGHFGLRRTPGNRKWSSQGVSCDECHVTRIMWRTPRDRHHMRKLEAQSLKRSLVFLIQQEVQVGV